MLRDRVPKFVSFALKYCKAKEAWLDHVYKNFIWVYVSKKERLAETRRVLGITNPKRPNFVFEDTIDWDNLDHEETAYWKNVGKYFPTKEDDAKTRKKKNKFINELVDFLIDCFENRIK